MMMMAAVDEVEVLTGFRRLSDLALTRAAERMVIAYSHYVYVAGTFGPCLQC